MFVRFRRLPNGGFRPFAAGEEGAFRAWRISDRRRRWFIDGQEPYRIKIILVDNVRTGTKVKEVIATLGAIDATWLEGFWTDQALKVNYWELYSLRWRVAFWRGVLQRMEKIGDNRLSKEDRIAIRRQIHKVIPWVTQIDIKNA
jgi:hypothetical protein